MSEAEGKSGRGDKKRSVHPLLVGLLLAVPICALTASFANTTWFSSAELQCYDLLTAYGGATKPNENVVLVDFDETTVRAYKAFPIPRDLLSNVVARISEGEAAVIGLDVLLDEPRGAAEDRELAASINHAGNVVLVEEYGFGHVPPSAPLPIFREAAAGVAFGDLPRDEDGVIRRMFFDAVSKDYMGLSFPVAIADLYSDRQLRPGGESFLLFGEKRIFLASRNPDSAWIGFHTSLPARRVSVKDLLEGNFDVKQFAGKMVLVGQSSSFGKDVYETPATHFMRLSPERALLSGTEIQAAAIETVLEGRSVRRVRWQGLWALNFLLCLAAIVLVLRLRPVYGVGLLFGEMLAVYFVALLLFARQAWLPFVSSEAALFLALTAGWGYRFCEERRMKGFVEAERRQLMQLFERYVSPEVAAEIWTRRDEIVLAGEERVATVLFSDIRNFTAQTAGRPSSEVLSWLNRYLTEMNEIVSRNGGFLNKFIGDGTMVVYGAPISHGEKEDACAAVKTALEMLARVEEMNRIAPPGQPRLKIGVGLYTGPLTVGNVGSPNRLEYSVIGETVNMASRLESLTKKFGTDIVMSEATRENVRERFTTFSLGETEVRGFQGRLEVFGVQPQSRQESSQKETRREVSMEVKADAIPT
jgi:adenylate cyclase